MRKLSILGLSAVLCTLGVVACGDDGDDNPGKPMEGEGGEGNSSSGGKAGNKSDGGSSNTTKAMGGQGGGDVVEPVAGAGGGGPDPVPCDIYGDRPIEVIPADAEGNITAETLTADKVWSLTGRMYVPAGQTLTIEPCTRIEGTPKPDAGSLFVMQGAKINAVGTPDAPILFTSEDHVFSDTPWGGVVLLGNAPIAPKTVDEEVPVRIFEGLIDERASYGGDVEDDDSGKMAYVRIEFGGDIIVTEPSAKEINGLSFGGVGSATEIHHIMVRDQYDDCFEWFGGTVDASYLICQNSGDDMFDADEGFKGHLQYLFGRNLTEGTSSDPNGFEWDGNQPLLTAPVATLAVPQASNATLCGYAESTVVSYGAVLRRSLGEGTLIQNAIVTGFNFGVDARDNAGTDAAPLWSWTNSLFFQQVTANGANPADDNTKDGTFDEDAWLGAAAAENVVEADVTTAGPEGFDCYAAEPAAPTEPVEGATPGDGFDAAGTSVGAGDIASDEGWDAGSWIDWTFE
jgi:hypothetical protein